ncbi:MAG: hypothetical protein AAF360_02750 [Pseudomonadota bacterium]
MTKAKAHEVAWYKDYGDDIDALVRDFATLVSRSPASQGGSAFKTGGDAGRAQVAPVVKSDFSHGK